MTIADWPRPRWIAATLGMVATALVIGIPTGIIESPFYTRMTPVLWWNYPVWIGTSVMSGLVLGTFISSKVPSKRSGGGLWANIGSLLAVGCPVCNKIVVAALGVSGAMSIWAPIQPVLAVASMALLAWALHRRLASERACPVPAVPALSGPA